MASDKHYLETELETLLQTDPDIWSFLREGSLDGVWYWDLENPEDEYMSPEFWRVFGIDPATKKHRTSEWQNLIFPEDLEIAKENLARHIEDPDHPYDQVVRYRRADGDTAWVRCRGLAVRDKSGKAIRLLGAHNDLTELKREQIAAQETNDLLGLILDTTQSGIIGLDDAGAIVSINAAGRHILGGLTDTLPCAWPEVMQFIDRDTLSPLPESADPVARALSGDVLSGKIFSLTRLGEREARYVRVSSAPTEADSAAVKTVLLLDDISEQEKNRQQVERTSRLDALGQLTGGIAHDFNNLLATVQYALSLAVSTDDRDRLEGYIQTAQTSVERGADLTKRLLAFAKQQPGIASATEAAHVLENFRKLASPLIESNIKVEFVALDPDIWVFCDAPKATSRSNSWPSTRTSGSFAMPHSSAMRFSIFC